MQRVPGTTLYDLIETNTHIEEALARLLYTQVCIGSRESRVSLEDPSGIYRLLNICRIAPIFLLRIYLVYIECLI